ncbi:unnamed protein product [Acanthoscelides obtectus]|uniref:Kinesin-like protein n=1 Tax=Acanthoscelides obtectus TaxID=200917 RepID=A0A9P0NZV9_ACAOB|nr:unnamed protein product [Acanthoscelides obtectus]CAK1658466.1 Kinesin-like protein KIF23 [Acanthoscelides obtectus]
MFAATKFTPTPRRLRREKTTISSSSSTEKQPVFVYCRLKPLNNEEPTSCMKVLSSQELAVTQEVKGTKKELCYKFKHIFTSYTTQREIFDHIAYPLLDDLLHGKNGLLFTYGITGSGKTYTLTGEQDNPGIMPRCIDTIFNSIEAHQAPKYILKPDRMNGFEIQTEDDAMQDRFHEVRTGNRTPKTPRRAQEKINFTNDGVSIPLTNEKTLYSVFVTYVEIYNNSVYDLLEECSGVKLQNKILREDSRRNMYVNGVTEVEVKSAQEAFEAFNAGQRRKKMAYTCLNAESSRSHSIFNIRVVQFEQETYDSKGKLVIPETNVITISQLSLVDLAGSERTNRTQNTGVRLKEASSINNSLMTLRTCMEMLRENQRSKANKVVPYRDSKLTYLFKNYFEGDGSVQMIVCINPSVRDLEENLHVLKFAEMSQDVKVIKPEPVPTVVTTKRTIKKPATPARIKMPALSTHINCSQIPLLKLDLCALDECENMINKVYTSLKQCYGTTDKFDKQITVQADEVRRRIVTLDKENILSKEEVQRLQLMGRKLHQKLQRRDAKIAMLEEEKVGQAMKQAELQNVVSNLHNVIDEKDLKLNQNKLDKEKTKQRLAVHSEKMNKELDEKLRRQREHLAASMKAKEIQIQKVREALNAEVIK